MFCPNCGANNSTEQKFCRSCGLNLEKTAESLLLQLPSAESANLLKREKMLEKFGNFAFAGFGLILLTGIGAIIYYIFVQMVLSGRSVFAGILLSLFMIFAILTLIYVVFNEDLKKRKQKKTVALPNQSAQEQDTAKLLEEKSFEPIPSIIENSTELIGVENKTRKF